MKLKEGTHIKSKEYSTEPYGVVVEPEDDEVLRKEEPTVWAVWGETLEQAQGRFRRPGGKALEAVSFPARLVSVVSPMVTCPECGKDFILLDEDEDYLCEECRPA